MDDPSKGWLTDEGGIDLRIVLARLWARRLWILTSIVLFTAVFGIAALLMAPVYRATTVLVPASVDGSGLGSLGSGLGQLGGLASLVGLRVNAGNTQTEEALAVLRSREFTEAFIRNEQLMPELFSEQWNAAASAWRGKEDDWPTLAQAYQYFHRDVRKITQDGKTGLVTVDVEWRDPAKCALWANKLVERLNAEMRARAIASTNASIGFLEKELEATGAVETRSAINRVMEAQINQRMLANVTLEYAFRVADKALPPDPDDPIRPNRPIMLILGPVLGAAFGAFVVLIAGVQPRRRANARP